MPLCNFGLKLLIYHVILPIGFFLSLEQRKHPMNYKWGENLTLSTLRLLAVSVIYSEVGEPKEI